MDHTGSLVSGLSWAFPQTCRNLGITGLTDHSLTINVTECIFVRKIKVPFEEGGARKEEWNEGGGGLIARLPDSHARQCDP